MNLVIDAHVHLGVDRAHGFSQDRAQLLERMDRAGVDFALAAPFARPDRMSWTNEVLASSLCDRILGAGLICPGSPDAVREIDRLIDDYGMRAALVDVEATFEYFLGHGLLSDRVTATFDRLADRSLPVLIHAHHPLQRFLTADLAVGIDALARRYPSLPLLVSTRVPALSLVLSHQTIYVESSLDTASPIDLDVLRRRIGPDRLLFASNSPIEHPLVKRMAFERIRCSAEDRSLMLGGCVARLRELLGKTGQHVESRCEKQPGTFFPVNAASQRVPNSASPKHAEKLVPKAYFQIKRLAKGHFVRPFMRSEVMSEPIPEEVRKLGFERLGRPPTEAEAKRIMTQLASLTELGRVTVEWQSRLDEIEPATTYRVMSEVSNGC